MTLEQTHRQRQAVNTIHDIVNAMRAIAAGRIQSAQRALSSARRYQQVVELAFGALLVENGALHLPASDSGRTMLLVLTSEQPLCGMFNQDVLAFAERRLEDLRAAGPVEVVVVGHRGVRQLMARGLIPDVTEEAATSVPGLRDLIKKLARLVDRRYAERQLRALHVVYTRYRSISEQIPTEEQILPLELTRFRQATETSRHAPYHYLPLPVLLAGLVSEYAFISLYRMAAESYASEQASRLLAMDAATRNTERLARALLDRERRERQDVITQQVLELIAARFAVE